MIDSGTASAFKDYKASFEGLPGYIAGLPSYPRNFSRDVILAGILAMDEDMLETQIRLSAAHQGRRDDAKTGEEAGKVHHEFPGVKMKGRGQYLTTYNANDATALFLIAIEAMGRINRSKYQEVIRTYQVHIILAVAHILEHTEDSIFYERPPGGANRFALKVTYWKDSIVPDPSGREELNYPVAYALSHFAAARGLMSAATILGQEELATVAEGMFNSGIKQFIQASKFVVAKTQDQKLAQASSDELHCLAYIPSRFKGLLPLAAIRSRARALETPVGFACTPKAVADKLGDKYHGYVVWPFEQAFIHYGCKKFGLADGASVARRVAPHIGGGNELLEVFPEVKPAGNNQQLWSVAASLYFAGKSSLPTKNWL